ncbi:MAG: toxin [Deltaproteobacteria bacterium]|nr:toxin [Deltaproteobacteria bacterium]
MSAFDWSDEENEMLERTRGVCFENALIYIQNGGVLDVVRHPSLERYPGQNIIVLNADGYIWLVPCVKQKGVRFLKTIIPSRKAAKEYLP